MILRVLIVALSTLATMLAVISKARASGPEVVICTGTEHAKISAINAKIEVLEKQIADFNALYSSAKEGSEQCGFRLGTLKRVLSKDIEATLKVITKTVTSYLKETSRSAPADCLRDLDWAAGFEKEYAKKFELIWKGLDRICKDEKPDFVMSKLTKVSELPSAGAKVGTSPTSAQ